jgi:hypothetical protein
VVRDHRSDSSPDVRDHRTESGSGTTTTTTAGYDDPRYQPGYGGYSNGYGVSHQDNSSLPSVNWSRARFSIGGFSRRASKVDSAMGVGVKLTGDLTSNLYLGVDFQVGPSLGEPATMTTATFTQAGLLAGVRGKLSPKFTIGAEGVLGVQEFRDLRTVIDGRLLAQYQVGANFSIGTFIGKNLRAANDEFFGIDLTFHSAQ